MRWAHLRNRAGLLEDLLCLPGGLCSHDVHCRGAGVKCPDLVAIVQAINRFELVLYSITEGHVATKSHSLCAMHFITYSVK